MVSELCGGSGSASVHADPDQDRRPPIMRIHAAPEDPKHCSKSELNTKIFVVNWIDLLTSVYLIFSTLA